MGTPAASDLHTTLVLERDTADFSTEAGNSALILKTKSPLRLVALFPACPAAKKNNNNEISVSPFWFHLGGNTMSRKKLSRRQFVPATALSSTALITAPYVRGAYAAGKLTMGFWDHCVPDA